MPFNLLHHPQQYIQMEYLFTPETSYIILGAVSRLRYCLLSFRTVVVFKQTIYTPHLLRSPQFIMGNRHRIISSLL